MKIALGTIEVDDEFRQAIWWWDHGLDYGGNPRFCPKADRPAIKSWYLLYGESMDDDCASKYQDAIELWNHAHSS